MALNISQLVATLQKVAASAGDLPIKLKAAEGDAETFLHSIEVEFGLDGTTKSTVATITHSSTAPAEPLAAPADGPGNPQDDQVASADRPIS